MQPLVLAIEPDLRQAAIVKRIVREKVLADVAVVDSRDAALEAMRTTVPDVLLLSTLLSPRDEDELVAHLRTLEHAQHLQTHTIPQLASAIGAGDAKPAKGLLSAFRRRKGAEVAPAGCDPDLFADEIRVYLQRASEKKREIQDAAAASPAAAANAPAVAAPLRREETPAEAPDTSSWSSPFEWRPSGRTTVADPEPPAPAVANPEPTVVSPALSVLNSEPAVADPEPAFAIPEPAVAMAEPEVVSPPLTVLNTEPAIAYSEPAEMGSTPSVVSPEFAVASSPFSGADLESVIALFEPPAAETVALVESAPAVERSIDREPAIALVLPTTPREKRPLVKRYAREWWYLESEDRSVRDPESELHEVLASLAIPPSIAAVGYANGCRIRRVRLMAA